MLGVPRGGLAIGELLPCLFSPTAIGLGPLGLLPRGASRLNSEPWEGNGAPSGVLSTFARPRGLCWWAWSVGLAPE